MLNIVLRRVGGAVAPEDAESSAVRSLGFFGAAAFQWVNPKAWVMALGAWATYLPGSPPFSTSSQAALLMAVINAHCVGIWRVRSGPSPNLTEPAKLRTFNLTMAALLVVSLYPIVVT
ncbi:hypothetical protein QLQ09_01085 [Brucella sp. NM4]|uniref:hypothetical protein n=1 Tax=Brucella/Ochrobactrum group TaxID=2826938 RepID=UPI0024BBF74C|nr:hypothetical protein [Brucella sp. NM4]WHS30212.1 hypothetical protein QLQ09_01085 [Brucella sp. NM4]WHT44304.1 hypothetical protein QLQ11_20965 [Ochrobactrum sp. SSR]